MEAYVLSTEIKKVLNRERIDQQPHLNATRCPSCSSYKHETSAKDYYLV